jgi:hypothetical protein
MSSHATILPSMSLFQQMCCDISLGKSRKTKLFSMTAERFDNTRSLAKGSQRRKA